MLKNYMEAQETASKMVLDAQKRFWDQYFDSMRKQPAGTPA